MEPKRTKFTDKTRLGQMTVYFGGFLAVTLTTDCFTLKKSVRRTGMTTHSPENLKHPDKTDKKP
jgi:hypothetical protein